MIKKLLLASLLSVTAAPLIAANYYVVVPIQPKGTPAASIEVALNSVSLPGGMVAEVYPGFDLNTALSVTGDPAFTGADVTWTVSSGSMPAGLVLNADGTISGMPTEASNAAFNVRAAYKTKSGEQTYQILTLQIDVTLQGATLPVGEVNTPYEGFSLSQMLSVTGDPGYTPAAVEWRSSDELPPGLTLNADGSISGTPTEKNESGASFNIIAGYKGKDGQQLYTIVVNGETLVAKQISVGTYHTCAVTTAGGAKCWGSNGSGGLGDNSKTNRLAPVNVVGLESGVAQISAGTYHTCAVTTSGTAKCWGMGGQGELGNGSSTSSSIPVTVTGLSGVKQISARGTYYTCAVTTAGGAKCWGNNGYGRLGIGSELASSTPVTVMGLGSGVEQIAVGSDFACALTTAGGVKCWGNNQYGQVGINSTTLKFLSPVNVTGLSGVTQISVGMSHTCARTSTGSVKCWGRNFFGGLGDGSTTNRLAPVNVTGLASGVVQISSGMHNNCAMTTAGAAMCWGRNNYGQLGDGTTVDRHAPRAIPGLSGMKQISGGQFHTCALTTSGAVKCWGQNVNGALGDGTTTDRLTPVDVVP